MSLDQILMIPGYSADGGGGGTPPAEFPDPGEQLLATVSSAPHFAYSPTRKLVTGATYAIQAQRHSDDATLDVGFVNGTIDTTSLESWAAGSDVGVRVLYDQSGEANAVDITETTKANQPLICESGSTVRDSLGFIKMKIPADKQILGTHGATLSSDDLTLFQCVQRAIVDAINSGAYYGFSLGDDGFSVRYETGYGGRFYTNSANHSLLPSNGKTHFSFWPSILSYSSDASTATAYRNHGQTMTTASTGSAATSTQLKIGNSSVTSEACLIGDVVLYPHLSDADRLSVYQSLNAYYDVGPDTVNTTAIIDQSEAWHVAFYDYLETITTGSVDITRSTLSWDGTYADVDQLFNLWMFAQDGAANGQFELSDAFKGMSEWYVLDDTDGGGIEGTQVLRHFYTGSQNGNESNNIAAWYSTSFPKAGSTEGNPYYLDSAVGTRAIVQSIVNLLGHDALALADNQSYGGSVEGGEWLYDANVDFHGGALLASVAAYKKCKSLLSTGMQTAFKQAFHWYTAKLICRGAHGINSNMDCKAIAGLARAYSEMDSTYQAFAVKAAKRILFGGTAEAPNDNLAASDWYTAVGNPSGIASPFGIVEGSSPEASYNGQTLKYLSMAVAETKDVDAWNFLDDVMVALANWYKYQTFPDGGEFECPTGYAGRTGGSIWNSDQGQGYRGRDVVVADRYSEFLPFVRHKDTALVDAATMVTNVTSNVSSINSSGFDGTNDITGSSAAHTSSAASYVVTLTNTPDLSGVTFGTGRKWWIRLGTAGSASWYELDAVDDGADTVTIASETVAIAGDTFTRANHRLAQNQDIYFTSTGTLPTGLTADTAFYVRDLTDNTFKVAATPGGTAITTSGGSGTHSYSEWGRANIASGSPVDYVITPAAREYHQDGAHWPPLSPWYPSAGAHTAIKALIDASDSSTYLPYELTTTFSRSVNDEVWQYMGNDGTLDFGWMVTAFENPGRYNGWYGGNLEAFWTRDYGVAILCKHDKSGLDPPDENTRVWAEIDTWAVTHVWGTNADGLNFSSAVSDNNDLLTRSTTFDLVSSPNTVTYAVTQGISEHTPGNNIDQACKGMEYSLEITSTAHTSGVASRTFSLSGTPDLSGIDVVNKRYVLELNDGVFRLVASVDDGADTVTIAASESTENIDSGSPVTCKLYQVPLAGYMTTTTTWKEATAGDGITVTTTVTSDNADKVDTLWGTIPCLLQRSGEAGSDATIAYWSGATWLPVSTSPVSADWVRLTRNHGSGDKNVFIHFSTTQTIRTSTDVYVQDYQENTRIRPIRVDLHPSSGTTAAMPASVSFEYDVQTTDPGLVATDPVASITYPTASDNMPVGRRWAALASVTWFGSSSFNVELQYSNNNQSTWNTVGTMSLDSGTPGSTACVYSYFGGTIPSGVTDIRLVASDDVGTTDAGTEVTIGSNTYTLVVNDPFTGTDATALGSSYSGFTTNTTGNSYVDTGPPEIQSNQASCSADDPTYAQTTGIKVLANSELNDFIVEADVATNTATNTPPTKGAGIHCRMRSNTTSNLVQTGLSFVLDVAGGAGSSAALLENTTQKDVLAITGFANGTVYRLSLDCRQTIVVYQVRNSGTDAVIAEGVIFDASYRLNEDDGKNAGVSVFKEAAGSSDTADDFKVWIPS